MAEASNTLVIHNAKIHTLDPVHPSASAIAIRHGQIVAVGGDDEIISSFTTTSPVDANGCAIIPGLTDAHIHLEEYAFSLQKIDCETLTRDECLLRVARRAITAAPGEWILGHGWNQNAWAEGYGTAPLLDAIAPNNPVYLTHKSLHSAWANSMALHTAGINRDTHDPECGRIGRLPDGEPDGILYESATNLLESAIPEPDLQQAVDALEAAIRNLWKFGLTGGHDFDHRRCFSALQVLNQQQKLKFRVLKGIPSEDLPHAVSIGLRSGFGGDMLRIGAVKMFSDGALGPQTAAMLQPYEDDPHNQGVLMMDANEISERGRMAVENGFSMAVHAIGDRANREVLNGYAHLRYYERSLPNPTHRQFRHRIEHVQVLHPDDITRFAELNIIASMQPIHATSDMLMADRYWGKRSAYGYAWRSLMMHHSHLAFGSDAPVESPNPFWGIHAAVTRRRADGTPSSVGWYPEQRLSVDEALQGFTTGAAYAAGMEERLGKLSPGYLADLLILDKDPYTCQPEELRDIHPLATMVGGEWVYSTL